MILDTDILHAYVKEKDWLKPVALRVIQRVAEGELGAVYASREALHELYYVSMAEGVSLDEYIVRAASHTAIDNLLFHPTTHEVDLLALTVMKQYRVTSIFDAYHAATTLNQDPNRTIVSTDSVFDKILGLTRVDPRDM